MRNNNPVAIVGIGCRFPGGSDSPETFRRNLCNGVNGIVEIPTDRWNIGKFYDPVPGRRGKSISKWGGFIKGLDLFDAEFFGISPREAPVMDPQQRLLLETAWEAIEDAGEPVDPRIGYPAGVFVGISTNDYAQLQSSLQELAAVDIYSSTGNTMSIAANRISYCLNLKGPSVAVDTACSSSLVAFHLACRALINGECRMALACGVNALISPMPYITFSLMGMISPDDACKTFDARANGFVRGEGVGVVALKRLEDALADGSRIYAVVRATALNQDGRTNGITMPNGESQKALALEACSLAGISPGRIIFAEAHGTGTPVGDPIEAHALGSALGRSPDRKAPLIVGSVKTNIGHLEAGAGIAGVIKTALIIKHGVIPPNLHFVVPNPNIDFKGLNIRVPTEPERVWVSGEEMIASVNSFGFGGANAHAILSGLPESAGDSRVSLVMPGRLAVKVVPDIAPAEDNHCRLLTVSAVNNEALKSLAGKYADYLQDHMASGGQGLADVCSSAALQRIHLRKRLCVVGSSGSELASRLKVFAAGETNQFVNCGEPPSKALSDPVFIFSGQGSQWARMGAGLLGREPVFHETIEKCDAVVRELGGWSLIEEMERPEPESRMDDTAVAQPAIFAVQAGLTNLWKSWGVKPCAIVGHSVGEVAAAYAAGALSLQDATRVIFHRGRCMALTGVKNGRMLAVGLSWADAGDAVNRFEGKVVLGANNSPTAVTLSGDADALQELNAELCKREIPSVFLQVKYAFHSHHMDSIKDELLGSLGSVDPAPPTIPVYSTVGGKAFEAGDFGAEYWWKNVRQSVLFAPVIEHLAAQGRTLFLEVSPHPVLTTPVAECLAHGKMKGVILASLRKKHDEQASLLSALGMLHINGLTPDWKAVMRGGIAAVKLPSYAWQKQSYWHEIAGAREARLEPTPHPLLLLDIKASNPTWQSRINADMIPYLKDHVVNGQILMPAAGFVEAALGAGWLIFKRTPLIVSDMDFSKALALSSDQPGMAMEFEYLKSSGRFFIRSAAAGQGEEWSVHSSGMLKAPEYVSESAFVDIQEKQRRISVEVKRDDIYGRFGVMGLPFGPTFMGIRQAWTTGRHEALARVSADDSINSESALYQVHPALLDACFQTLGVASLIKDGSYQLFLPVGIDNIVFYAKPPAEVWVHAVVQGAGSRFLVGDIAIADASGKVFLQLKGFRCQALARGGSGSGSSGWLYKVGWRLKPSAAWNQETAAAAFPPAADTADLTQSSTAEWFAAQLPFRRRVVKIRPKIDRLALLYVMQAFAGLGWRPRRGTYVTHQGLMEKLGIAPRHAWVVRRYLSHMARHGVLREAKDGWKTVDIFADDNTEVLWNELLAAVPVIHTELTLIRKCGLRLADILAGREDAVNLVFNEESFSVIEAMYQDSYTLREYNILAAEAVAAAVRSVPRGRVIRILEIGAGTGGTTSHILPRVPADRTEYYYTDLSPMFFSKAEPKFYDYPFVRFQPLDIENDPEAQGFAPGSFDMIVASNVLHAVKDLRSVLARVKNLLAPGGLLLAVEAEKTDYWVDIVFGLMEGWWRFTDHELRPDYSLLDRRQWQALLKSVGFSSVGIMPGNTRTGDTGQVVYLAGTDVRTRSLDVVPEDAPAADKKGAWLFFEDERGVGAKLAEMYRRAGCRVMHAKPGEAYSADGDGYEIRPESPDDMKRLIAECESGGALSGIVHLWALDAVSDDKADTDYLLRSEALGCHTILHLLQVVALRENRGEKFRLCLVTRGAVNVLGDEMPAVAQAPLWGIGRVAVAEKYPVQCRMIDLSPVVDDGEIGLLFTESLSDTCDAEVAIRGSARYVARLSRVPEISRKVSRWDAACYRVENPSPGMPDKMVFRRAPIARVKPDEVEIEVKAAALNFRDVMKSLGIYPISSDADLLLGDECAGRIIRCGSAVKGFKVGDDALIIGSGCFASRKVVHAGTLIRMPVGLTHEESVTIPVAFLTAWYALCSLARLRSGEKVLIHAATGGVGLAAIQIARHVGAEIFATAGSDEKRELLRAIGVKYVMNSRTTEFADLVMRNTGGRGVDAVLNSLSGQAIPASLGVLAPHGRFLELGKTDVYQNSSIGLKQLRNNNSLHIIDLAQVMADNPELIREIFGQIAVLFDQGVFHALPHRIFPVSQIVTAFRRMAQARHVGKLVLSMKNDEVYPLPGVILGGIRFREHASYLICGGTGGFGSATALWMARNGARNLILAGRSGRDAAGAAALAARLKALGAAVSFEKVDITRKADVDEWFKRIKRRKAPLRGIIQSAMVMDDGAIMRINRERFMRVTAPKIQGTWNLHAASLGMPLDFFVMFSSLSSLFATPGQSPYVSANLFQDSMAHYRRARGLPALTVNWGRLADVGYVSRHAELEKHLDEEGLRGVKPEEALEMLGRLMMSDAAQVGVGNIDWQKVAASRYGIEERLSDFVGPFKTGVAEAVTDVREAVMNAASDERLELLNNQLKAIAAKVLRIAVDRVDINRPLNEMGMDSLMAVELLTNIESCYHVSLPASKLTAGSSIGVLSGVLLELLCGRTGSSVAVAAGKAQASAAAEEVPSACLFFIRKTGKRPPLLCLHPSGGLAGGYEAFARALPAEVPVAGVQSRVWCGNYEELESIERMAEAYVNLVVKTCPENPYRLFGFSMGGFLAVSMARIMENRGIPVSFVGLADCRLEWALEQSSRKSYVHDFLMDMFAFMARELKAVDATDESELSQLTDDLGSILSGVAADQRAGLALDWLDERKYIKSDISRQLLAQYVGILVRHIDLISTFKPAAVKARMAYWRSSQSNAGGKAWGQYAQGGLHEYTVACSHYAMMSDPYVGEVSATVDGILVDLEKG